MSARPDSLVLVHSKNGQILREIPLEGGLTIGRQAGNGLQIEDLEVSRNQAIIQREGESWFLADVGSRNGTDVDGRRLAARERAELRDGSVARIGPFELRFRIAPILQPTGRMPAATAPVAPHVAAATPAPPSPVEPPPPPSPLMAHLLDPRSRIPVWSEGLATLKVADIIEETQDAKTFRFVGESPMLFSFKPGQFITLQLPIDGKEVRRSYSISSSPSRPHALEITVKRVPGGLVSNHLNDNLKLGDRIQARGPSGKFSCFEYPSRKILALAGGSGITPIMSMARWIVDTAADVDFTLLYSARSPQDIIFRKELEWMSSRHSGFRVLITVSSRWHGVDAWTGCTGRIDARLMRYAAPDLEERHAFMCGPVPYMDAAKESLKEAGFPLAQLHLESFGAGRVAKGVEAAPAQAARPAETTPPPSVQVAAPVRVPTAQVREVPAPAPAPAAVAPAPAAAVVGQGRHSVRFKNSNKSIATDGETPLLELAEQLGVEIEYGCRSGSCGSCRVRCNAGAVDLPDDCCLDTSERESGWALACVGRPRADVEVQA